MVKENDIITDGTTKWKVRRLGGSSDGNPIGTIIMYAANTMPEGYLLCDGSAVSRTNYAALFAVIGTTWGAGDGSTTFNLPNAVGRFPEGSATAGGYIEAGLPNIIGSVTLCPTPKHFLSYNAGALFLDNVEIGVDADGFAPGDLWKGWQFSKVRLNINASFYNAIYGKSATNQPSAFTTKYLIKYI